MKLQISRQMLYLTIATLITFILIIMFSIFVLVPEAKSYRIKKVEKKAEMLDLYQYKNYEQQTLNTLKSLQDKNKNILKSFDETFDTVKFQKHNKKYFESLSVINISEPTFKKPFAVFEINTSSKIDSPSSFFEFIDSLNKSDWIIGIEFPIAFKREGELIDSSFKMKVYYLDKSAK